MCSRYSSISPKKEHAGVDASPTLNKKAFVIRHLLSNLYSNSHDFVSKVAWRLSAMKIVYVNIICRDLRRYVWRNNFIFPTIPDFQNGGGKCCSRGCRSYDTGRDLFALEAVATPSTFFEFSSSLTNLLMKLLKIAPIRFALHLWIAFVLCLTSVGFDIFRFMQSNIYIYRNSLVMKSMLHVM